MGERGPRPKPKAMNDLAGNPGKRSGGATAPEPKVLTNLKPPKFLPLEAKHEWKRVVMHLAALDLISDLDVMALAAYCNSYATWFVSGKKIKETGLLIKTPNGYYQVSPYVKIQRDAQDEMLKLLKEFGMTPAARARVGGSPEGDEDDEFDLLMKRKNGGAA